MRRRLVAVVQDHAGVLNRCVSLFRQHGHNIDSLVVTRTTVAGISRMTWIVDAETIDPLLAQLNKLIEVIDVFEDPNFSPTAPNRCTCCAPATTPFRTTVTQADGGH